MSKKPRGPISFPLNNAQAAQETPAEEKKSAPARHEAATAGSEKNTASAKAKAKVKPKTKPRARAKESAAQADAARKGPLALPADKATIREPAFEPETPETEGASLKTTEPIRAGLARRLLLAGLGGLAALGLALFVEGIVSAAYARADWLGWLALALLALAALAALMLLARELAGLWRLRRIARVRDKGARLSEQAQAGAADEELQRHVRALAGELVALYGRRADMRWALARLREHDEAVLSAAERLALIERELLAPLDARAKLLIVSAARRVAGLTAIVPMAALDVLIVALANLRLLRQLAALYGGRPGFLGGWKLARMVLAHMTLSGTIALADALLPNLLGKGLAGRFTARFGEGMLNGVLSARIGLAALDLVRPLPFSAVEKPGLRDIITNVLKSMDQPPTES